MRSWHPRPRFLTPGSLPHRSSPPSLSVFPLSLSPVFLASQLPPSCMQQRHSKDICIAAGCQCNTTDHPSILVYGWPYGTQHGAAGRHTTSPRKTCTTSRARELVAVMAVGVLPRNAPQTSSCAFDITAFAPLHRRWPCLLLPVSLCGRHPTSREHGSTHGPSTRRPKPHAPCVNLVPSFPCRNPLHPRTIAPHAHAHAHAHARSVPLLHRNRLEAQVPLTW